MAFYKVEPFGPDREDFRAGVVASTIANVFKGRGKKSVAPTDPMFMPIQAADEAKRKRYRARRGNGTAQQIRAVMDMFNPQAADERPSGPKREPPPSR